MASNKENSLAALQVDEKMLFESLHLLEELRAQSKELAQQLRDTHDKIRSDYSNVLNGETVKSVRDRIIEIKANLVSTTELVPQLLVTMDVPWIGQDRDKLNLVYLSGDNPWEFYLTYPDDQNTLEMIKNTVKTMRSKGVLENCPPKVGDFVVCRQLIAGKHDYFRGVITNYKKFGKGVRSVHVYRLDTGGRTAVLPEDVYHVPRDIMSIPSRAIKCCFLVGDEHLKKHFCKELRLAFKHALENSILTVNVLGKADVSKPPCFFVRVWGVDKIRGVGTVDLNEWQNDKVMTGLRKIPPECSDVFAFIDEYEMLDPYYDCEIEVVIIEVADVRGGNKMKKEAKVDMEDSAAKSASVAADVGGGNHTKEAANVDTEDLAAKSTNVADSGGGNQTKEAAKVDMEDSAPKNANVADASNMIQVDTVTSSTADETPDEPDPHLIAASVDKVAKWLSGGPSSAKIPRKLPPPEPVVEPSFEFALSQIKRNRRTPTETPLQQAHNGTATSKVPTVDSTVDRASDQTEENTRKPNPLEQPPPPKPARLSKFSKPDDAHNEQHKENYGQNKIKSIEPSNLSPSAPEFVPKSASAPEFARGSCLVQITNNGNDDNYDGLVTNLQEEYQPTDEKRICLFYQKNGYCGRKLCGKEHVSKSAVWTTDKATTYDTLFNDIDLPTEGSEVVLAIQHIKNPVSFYATLSERYSDTGEPLLETMETLHADLNSEESNNTHPLLTSGPQTTEIVIALGHQEFLGPRKQWLRARVMEVLDDALVRVFFLDFGNREILKQKDLRKIRPQFLHLPAQAVLTKLHRIVPNPEKKEEAVKFLEDSIRRKVLTAKVIVSDVLEPQLDVILYTENGDYVNNILVNRNLAELPLI